MSKPLPKLIRVTTVPISLDKLLEGQLQFLNHYYEVIAVSSPPVEYLKNIEHREGIEVKAIDMARGISPLKDIKSLIQLIILFRKEKPTIVHSITPKAGLLSMLAGKISRVPVRIHTFTGLIFPSKKGGIQKLLIAMDRLLCWSATHIIPEGRGVQQDLLSFRITKKPLKILANGNVNGINTSYFNPAKFSLQQNHTLRQKLVIKKEDFIFIFVGRLVSDKGINELVAAFKNLRLPIVSKLLLVGPYEKDLDPLHQETLDEINTNPNIITTGFQEDVRPYLAISDALAFPSYREGFPNVVMQAGAMGLPSIVTNINGCNEIIIKDKNGIIIPSKNAEALEQAMHVLSQDQELYKTLKRNARHMITSRYQQKIVWEALLEEYNRLLKEKGIEINQDSSLDPETSSG